MAPTPEQLIINPQTINVQTPQVQEQITQAPQYVEGEVSMPSPQQWIGNINYGLDWYGLGAKAFGVAGTIYEELQKYGLRRRREYAQDDMNKIQAISVEKPDPSFNDYQIEDFYKAQSKRLRESTREALKRQGFSEYNIDRILPKEGTSGFDPSELTLPASDMDSLLGFTRYFDLTNQEFSNQITKYNEINWQNSKESYLEGEKRAFGAIDGRSPFEIKQDYDNRILEMQDNVHGRSDRQTIVDQYKASNNYEVALKTAISNAQYKTNVDFQKEVASAYEEFTKLTGADFRFSPIATKQFADKIEALKEKREKELIAISSIDPNISPISTIQGRRQEYLNRNPNAVYEFNIAQINGIDERIRNISTQLAEASLTTNYKLVEDLRNEQRNLIDRKLTLTRDTYVGTNKVFLNNQNQSSYSALEKQYEELSKQKAEEQATTILQTATKKGILDFKTYEQEFERVLSGLAEYKQQSGISSAPTKEMFLQLVGKQSYDQLNLSQQMIYDVLADEQNNKRLSTIDSPRQIEFLRTQLLNEYLIKQVGGSIGPQGQFVFKYDVEKAIADNLINRELKSPEAHQAVRGAQQKQAQDENLDRVASENAANPYGRTSTEVTKNQPLMFSAIMSETKTNSAYWSLFSEYNEESAKQIAFQVNNPAKRERFVQAVMENPQAVNLKQITEWAKTAVRTSDNLDVQATARFFSYVARNTPNRLQLRVEEQSKLDPKVFLRDFDKFEKAYETALKNLSITLQGPDAKKASNLLQLARTYWITGARREEGVYQSFGDVAGISEMYPNFDDNVEAWAEYLGGDFDLYFDENQFRNLIIRSGEDGSDFLSPIVMAQLSLPPDAPKDQVLELAKEFGNQTNVKVLQSLDKDGKVKTILSSDMYGLTTTSNLIPKTSEVSYQVSPSIRTGRTLDNIRFNKYPSYIERDGKPYIPTDSDGLTKHDEEFMLQYVASALPGSASVDNIRGSTEMMNLIQPLFEVYKDPSLTAEQRKQKLFSDPRIKEWIYITQQDRNASPNSITQSRINALHSIADQPELTAKTMVEIGLNSPSHISDKDRNDPATLALKRTWKPFDRFTAEYTRNSDYKEELDDSQNATELLEDKNNPTLRVAQPNLVEPVIFYDPDTGERINTNPFGQVNIGSNRFLELPFETEGNSWLQQHVGETWDMIDTKGNIIPNVVIQPNQRDIGFMGSEFKTLEWDSVKKTYVYSRVYTGSTGTGGGVGFSPTSNTTQLQNQVIPYRLKERTNKEVLTTPYKKIFDSESSDYDYETAKTSGMKPDDTGHWGSVVDASEEDKKKYNLPDESYIILKGKNHKTWDLMEKAEQDRGFKVVKLGNRYYSVPKLW